MFILHKRSLCLLMSLFRNGIPSRPYESVITANFIKLLENVQPVIVGRFKKPFCLFPYSIEKQIV